MEGKGALVLIILVDIFEPDSIVSGLETGGLEVVRTNLAQLSLGDYLWESKEGRHIIERKTWGELLSDMGNRLDDQLRRFLSNTVHLTLLLENTPIGCSEDGCCELPTKALPVKRGILLVQKQLSIPYITVIDYLWRLQQDWGIALAFSPEISITPRVIGGLLNNSNKNSHTTLSPYRKRKKQPSEPNPYIETLMGLGGCEIGEITANKILSKYPTPIELFNADPKELGKAIGKKTAESILKAVGRLVERSNP